MNFLIKLSYKQKTRLCLFASFFFLILVYSLGIEKTIVVYKECNQLASKIILSERVPAELLALENQWKKVDRIFQENDSTLNHQQSLLGVVAKYCNENHILLNDFPRPIVFSENNILIETNQFTVEGNFIKLLKLIYNLEKKNKDGQVASADFFIKKNYTTKNRNLKATVYIQNLKNNNHEK